MKKRADNGFVATDIIISIIAIMIFSVVIVSLLTYNVFENIKVRRNTLAIIYLTETLENIGIAPFEEVIQENANNFIPAGLEEDNYEMKINITNDLNIPESDDEEIVKKVFVKISYNIGDKKYQQNIERIKVKE